MAVISLRQQAACIGVTGGFSVVRDLYGYRSEKPRDLSLRLQLSLLRNPHVHLDVLLVGADQMLPGNRRLIDRALHGAREIFEQVPLGIGRVSYFVLNTDEADGFEILSDKAEAKRLTRRFRGPHDDALDVFFVLEYNEPGKVGLCNIMGCCKGPLRFQRSRLIGRPIQGWLGHRAGGRPAGP
jgi:hypothetical protein